MYIILITTELTIIDRGAQCAQTFYIVITKIIDTILHRYFFTSRNVLKSLQI